MPGPSQLLRFRVGADCSTGFAGVPRASRPHGRRPSRAEPDHNEGMPWTLLLRLVSADFFWRILGARRRAATGRAFGAAAASSPALGRRLPAARAAGPPLSRPLLGVRFRM